MNSAVDGFIVASICIDTTVCALTAGNKEREKSRYSHIRFIKASLSRA
jgi:hypothetical protein